MEEELKERWTTLIRPGKDYGYTDKSKKALKRVTEVYNDLSEYKPKYIHAGVMGWNSKTRTYPLLKPIKVRRPDGGFDFYMVPLFAVKGIYVDKPKPVVEPIADLAPLNNLQAVILPLQASNQVPPKSNTVIKLQTLKPVTIKSNTVVKLPVPLNLLPYIANVTSDGVAFFNIPEGYTNDLFEEAVKAVYGLNNGLAKKPMVYYEQPQLLILQLKQQLLAALLSLKLYLAQRLLIALLSLAQKLHATLELNMEYNTSNNAQTVKVPVKNINKPDLIAEVFAYPKRLIDVYNIHPEAYLKVLEYLNQNFKKTKTNNKPEGYVLSLSGFDKVPIGGEVNDSVFHYIGKNGEHEWTSRWHDKNPNIINKNEPLSYAYNYDDIITNNGKLKMYSYSNGDDVYYKDRNGVLRYHPFTWHKRAGVYDYYYDNLEEEQISYLREHGLNELLIKDFINKSKNFMITDRYDNVDKSIFRPIEKELSTLNNSGLHTKNTNNLVLKAKLAGKKVLSFLGFLNGGQLKYYENPSLLYMPDMHYLTGDKLNYLNYIK